MVVARTTTPTKDILTCASAQIATEQLVPVLTLTGHLHLIAPALSLPLTKLPLLSFVSNHAIEVISPCTASKLIFVPLNQSVQCLVQLVASGSLPSHHVTLVLLHIDLVVWLGPLGSGQIGLASLVAKFEHGLVAVVVVVELAKLLFVLLGLVLVLVDLAVLVLVGLRLALPHELLLLLTLSLISVILHAFVHIEVHMHALVDIALVIVVGVGHIASLVHLIRLVLRSTLHPSVKVLLHFHVSLLLD